MENDRARQGLGVTTRPRDIYEDETFEGLRQLELVASNGRKCAVVLIRESWMDQRFMGDLWALLDRKDPARIRTAELRIVPSR